MTRILPFVLLVAACSKASAPPPPPVRPALEHASQADLAHDIADAERLGTWREVQHRWEGQSLRWTVTRQRLLCGSADDCNVAAFPIQRPAQQGWMPLLAFAPGQYDVLAQTCGNRDQCDVTIEGTLSELEVSPEFPTTVRLSGVRIVPAGIQTAHN
jgi:hypothetical protein